jgi:fatty-acyl-CoA synthase
MFRRDSVLPLDPIANWFIVVDLWILQVWWSRLSPDNGARNPDSVSFLNLWPGLFLTRSARVYPTKAAIQYNDVSYSYAEFDDRVQNLAGAFVNAGISAGDRVAYLVPNIPQLLEGHYGPMRMGAVLIAINIRLSSREIGFILRHSGAKALIFDSEYADTVKVALEHSRKLDNTSGPDEIKLLVEVVDTDSKNITPPASGLHGAIEYEKFLSSGENVSLPTLQRSELDTIAIDYTSGTTGEPKGVEYTGRGAYLNALGQCVDAGLRPSSTYLWTLPMFHCNGWCYTWAVTAAGGTHVCLRRVTAEDVFSLVEQHGVTHMCAAPSVLTVMESSEGAEPGVLAGTKIITGGAPPSPKMLRTMKSLGADLVHAYGLTETYGPSAFAAEQPGWNDLSIEEQAHLNSRQGVPNTVAHVGVRVVDEQMNDVPADAETIGEVVTRGNTIMAGYYNDPEGSQEAFTDGWFHTGDLAVMHADGYMELKDRKKDVIISGGENISSVEVEMVLMEHPAVLETCVVGVPDDQWGESPKAFVSLREGFDVEASEIIAFCRDRIAHYKAPRSVEFGELPKTATGKIQKYLLREREWAGHKKRIG